MEDFKNKKWLENKYLIEKKSICQIAKEYKIVDSTIYYWLKKFNIVVRSISEAKKGKKFSKEHIKNYQNHIKVKNFLKKLKKKYLKQIREGKDVCLVKYILMKQKRKCQILEREEKF